MFSYEWNVQVFWTVKTVPGWAWNWKTQNKPKYHIPIKFGHSALHDGQSCNERIVVAPVWNIHVYIWYLCSKYAVHYRKCLIVILQELNIKPAYALLSFFDIREINFTFWKERKSAPKNSVKIKIKISPQHKLKCFHTIFHKMFWPKYHWSGSWNTDTSRQFSFFFDIGVLVNKQRVSSTKWLKDVIRMIMHLW